MGLALPCEFCSWLLIPCAHGSAAGKDLNKDLKRLQQRHGQDHILMELRFPQVQRIHHSTPVP